ncbi:hypothetical protein K1719_023515 [Acacia pycnantha]|nr:hypothetical protein K1719_023515 [Acacia pycnantha]
MDMVSYIFIQIPYFKGCSWDIDPCSTAAKFQLKESWYEKLQRWDDALKAYTAKASQATSPHLVLDATLGRMRCLAALARWEELNNLCKEYWTPAEPAARLEMAPMVKAIDEAMGTGFWALVSSQSGDSKTYL